MKVVACGGGGDEGSIENTQKVVLGPLFSSGTILLAGQRLSFSHRHRRTKPAIVSHDKVQMLQKIWKRMAKLT